MQSHLDNDEVARLKALSAFRVLDSPKEATFDQITELGAYLCGTPICLIGFIDKTREWFKSAVGWDAREIPRNQSFAAHSVQGNGPLLIEDATKDERFCRNPLVTQGGIRFYAGVPLISSDGYCLGAMSVMDTVPRALPEGHKNALVTLAKFAMAQLDLRIAPTPLSTPTSSREPSFETKTRPDQGLRESQERLEGIVSSAMDAIISVNEEQRIVVFNRAAEEIFRCPASQACGESIDIFIPERFRQTHRRHIESFGRTGVSSRSACSPAMLSARRLNGEEFAIEATISQTMIAQEKLYTVILRDVSLRERNEEQLRQSQKMETLGQLAGGISHEFNNYLSIILGYSELLASKHRQNESLRRELAEIRSATHRAASLTKQLLAFSRKQMIEPEVVDLNAAIWETHKLLRRLIPVNIDIKPILQPELGQIKADPGQIQQLLINVVVNARDAMPNGGKITIETASVNIDEHSAEHVANVKPGDYVMLSMSDTGQGMDSEVLSHIFEPFFTTKKGKGTGLGLSTVYGIVKQSGGDITATSVLGNGTTLRIYFPKLLPADSQGNSAAESSDQHRGTSILIVEDEEPLRQLLKATLEHKGFTLLEARDGQEAMSILESYAGSVDLIITDIVMPRMNGLQLREKVRGLRPTMKFILMSGYAETVENLGENGDLDEFLEKPFLIDKLLSKVCHLLDLPCREHNQRAKTA